MAMLSFRHNIIRTLTSDCYCSAPYHPQIGQTVVVQLHIILKLARLLLFSSISSSNWPDCCCSAPYHPQIGQTAVVQLHIILKLTRIARNTGLQAVLTGGQTNLPPRPRDVLQTTGITLHKSSGPRQLHVQLFSFPELLSLPGISLSEQPFTQHRNRLISDLVKRQTSLRVIILFLSIEETLLFHVGSLSTNGVLGASSTKKSSRQTVSPRDKDGPERPGAVSHLVSSGPSLSLTSFDKPVRNI
ncbi:hypothetical protein RRG08_064477 [Elysia crispata]|uniref:Uncharacterized protein n=1 Tax=Elysia crispata TaxID=231223 RepID=A0AAE1AE87_9GAST|nr:hypothetical protein RRG08_064477 [Elysia crispata]